jgi:hypothetical protein
MRRLVRLAPLLVLTLLAGCTDSGKAAAEAAIDGASKAITPLKFEAVRFAPKQLEEAEATLLKAREKLTAKDYQAALSLAGEVGTRTRAMAASIEERKAALTREYEAARAEATALLGDLRKKIDEAAAAKKKPAGADAASLANARADVEAAEALLPAAAGKLKEGAIAEAVVLVEQAKIKVAGPAQAFGLVKKEP